MRGQVRFCSCFYPEKTVFTGGVTFPRDGDICTRNRFFSSRTRFNLAADPLAIDLMNPVPENGIREYQDRKNENILKIAGFHLLIIMKDPESAV